MNARNHRRVVIDQPIVAVARVYTIKRPTTMKTEIAAEETKGMLREALEQKYGEVFDIGQIEVITKRPKNEPVQIGVIVDMTPKSVTRPNPVLSAVADK